VSSHRESSGTSSRKFTLLGGTCAWVSVAPRRCSARMIMIMRNRIKAKDRLGSWVRFQVIIKAKTEHLARFQN
jgi:uncharacterized membrane protein